MGEHILHKLGKGYVDIFPTSRVIQKVLFKCFTCLPFIQNFQKLKALTLHMNFFISSWKFQKSLWPLSDLSILDPTVTAAVAGCCYVLVRVLALTLLSTFFLWFIESLVQSRGYSCRSSCLCFPLTFKALTWAVPALSYLSCLTGSKRTHDISENWCFSVLFWLSCSKGVCLKAFSLIQCSYIGGSHL